MKMLTREEIDKLLKRDELGRPPTRQEIQLLQAEISKRKQELHIPDNERLPKDEVKKVIKKLGLDDIEITFS